MRWVIGVGEVTEKNRKGRGEERALRREKEKDSGLEEEKEEKRSKRGD